MTFEAGRNTIELELDRPHPAGDPALEIVEWSAKFGSELVLCDGEGVPLASLPTRAATQDADFTAFVGWAGFDPADVHLADAGHETYQRVLTKARAAIDRHFAGRAPERPAHAATGRTSEPPVPRSAGRDVTAPARRVGAAMPRPLGAVLASDEQRPHVPAHLSQAGVPPRAPAG
ncbi:MULTISPECIES: hypothetical protein [Micromonospora]|uniref:Uncharacterized protein n=1 Tax=Micromonospora solifontis TaxID=2487138 RepID=A0ABX9WJG2_9ACTN|nr:MULTISPECIES: hypothetical protein [Micromonospora]NES15421.1 hypothetical protein [Micromonospora sp. PPF5-17B]NES35833.1 hypothetical protein [Micromonospora solifontis]NES58015.1 hypothetical protein [Micromonospora sp. PPF5-6]RNM00310.1 hypothetical protein EFE23_06590 [Micromonospora solifontis]